MHCFSPTPNQSLGILQPMNPTQNPIVDRLVPSDYFDPVVNMGPYQISPQIGGLGGLGSVQEALSILQATQLLFG